MPNNFTDTGSRANEGGLFLSIPIQRGLRPLRLHFLKCLPCLSGLPCLPRLLRYAARPFNKELRRREELWVESVAEHPFSIRCCLDDSARIRSSSLMRGHRRRRWRMSCKESGPSCITDIRTRMRLNSTDVEVTRVVVVGQCGNKPGPDILGLCLLLCIAPLTRLGGGSILDLSLGRVVVASITA